jgi:hypothetical protein
MAQVKLSATLPKDDTGANGLDTLSKALINRPTGTYLVVGMVTAAKTVVDHERGNARQPEIRFIAIEGVLDDTEREDVERVLTRCRARREGTNPDQGRLDVFGEQTRGPGTHYGEDDV